MPVYNVADYLEKSVNSVLNQNFESFELILIDDGSTDDSPKILDNFNKNECVTVVHAKNAGSGIARNRGLNLARGEYIYFMDPDDWLEGEMLKDNYQLINKNHPDVLLFGYYDHFKGKIRSQSLSKRIINSKSEFLDSFPELFRMNVLYTVWNKLYKKSFLINNDLNFGSERNGQDYLFNIKVYSHLSTMLVNDKKYYHYIVQRNNAATTKFHEDMFVLYKNEQLNLIKFMMENGIKAEDIVSNRWYFILNSCWKRANRECDLKKTNEYINNILQEYKQNKYIKLKNLSNYQCQLKYLLFFKTGLYKYYKHRYFIKLF